MIKEAIILAGGLGTRLRDAVPDLPKCMAPVAGRPFLFYVINYLRSQGIEKFIFSLGYKHELIEAYLQLQFPTLRYDCCIETEPLGTGGAILLSCSKATEENVLVANGDTLFTIDVSRLATLHREKQADLSLGLKPMKNFDRYGTVMTASDGRVTGFNEKQFCAAGNINGGIYLLHVPSFISSAWPAKFSFEKEYLEVNRFAIYAQVQDEYFIDIGIPADYARAQEELKAGPLDLKLVDQNWTLFIDRDGVVNHEKPGDYIRNRDEFVFYEGVKEAFARFNQKFGRIIIISNQRGVGKGLMTEDDLNAIHRHMQAEIEAAGGRIDGIYYCTSTDPLHPNRKPNPGMAFQARQDFPGIDLSRTIIAGNKPSDMLFGRNAGIYTAFIQSTNPDQPLPNPDIDLAFPTLADFAKAL